jgi:hypothetical protein
MAAFKRAVRRYGLNEALAIERFEPLERSRSGCVALNPSSLFTFLNKLRLATAIASEHLPSLAIPTRVIESSTCSTRGQGLAWVRPAAGLRSEIHNQR